MKVDRARHARLLDIYLLGDSPAEEPSIVEPI
jgi:hypothetical protein